MPYSHGEETVTATLDEPGDDARARAADVSHRAGREHS